MKTLRASRGVSFTYQTAKRDCLILCLHISLPQSFGGVSQEGYKLQQTGQVVRDFIISSTVWNVAFWFCMSVSHCAEGKHGKHQETWI